MVCVVQHDLAVHILNLFGSEPLQCSLSADWHKHRCIHWSMGQGEERYSGLGCGAGSDCLECQGTFHTVVV